MPPIKNRNSQFSAEKDVKVSILKFTSALTFYNRELTILGRERRPRLHKTKTAITEIKAVQLCRTHNLKDLLSE